MNSRLTSLCLLLALSGATATGTLSARAQNQITSQQNRSSSLFRSMGLLGPGASLTKVVVKPPQASLNRVAAGALSSSTQNLTGPLKFSFTGYTAAQQTVLQSFLNANYSRMVAVYGAPAPEQAGKTVTVQFEAGTSAYIPPKVGGATGGTIIFGFDGGRNNDVNTYNFTRLALIAFQGPRVPAFNFLAGDYVEPWLYGMADAGAILVAYQAQGSPANFNPSALGGYVLPVYDFLNRPELSNAYIYPRSGSDLAISAFRLAMAQAAFLKMSVENPNFLAQFNAALYGRGAAGTAISVSELQGLAAGVVPTVEGRSFSDWVRAQYALDSNVTSGQKLYLALLPSPAPATGDTRPGFSGFAQAFATDNAGSETASGGLGSVAVFDETGRDVSNLSVELLQNNVLNFGADPQFPGEARFGAGFSSLGTPDRALLTVKARYGQAEATSYFPAGVVGNVNSTSSFYGGTLGGQNGLLQLSGSATQNVPVTRGVWEASAPYSSGPRVQTAFTFGGVTLRRNTAFLAPGNSARSVGFLLQVPSSLQTLNFTAPAGQSQLRMVSLPGFPIKTDEAAALNLAPDALKLARYRPNLSPATLQNGSLVFGIGAGSYEIYPNISAPLAPGRGYWLGVDASGYSTQVQASPPPADKATEVPLIGGWNQIGVPFNRTMAASAIQVRNGGFAPVSLATAQSRGWVAPGLWRWLPEGGYVRADVGDGKLNPFEGYFIFAGPERGVALVFDPTTAATANARTSALTKTSGWSLNLTASGKNTRDIAGRFGVSDAPNIAKPPAAARVVSLRFEGADANGASAAGSGLAESYATQAQLTQTKTASWSAIVDGTAPGETVTLQWDKFDASMRNLRLSLLDTVTGASTAMKSGGQYQFVSDGTPRRLTIVALESAGLGKVEPTLTPDPARTRDALTVTPNASGFAPDAALTYSYVWRNGRRILDNDGATLDLSQPGNGDRGDTISVEVTASDEAGNIASGTASTVIANSAPLVADGNLRVQSGQTASVALFASDADGDELRINRSNSPQRGLADVRREDGVWKLFYTPYKGATGDDEVDVLAFDSFGGRSQTAKIKISVGADKPGNRAPVAISSSVASVRGEIVSKTLMASDADGDALSFRMVTPAKFGSSEIALDAADGQWKLRVQNLRQPDGGADSVQFVAIDAQGAQSNIATITIYVRNRPPVAGDVSATAASGVEIAVPVSGSDADGDELTFKRVGGPTNGTGELRLDSDGAWKMFYRSRAGWTGVENVRYVAIDAQGRPSAPATIAISVTPSSAASALTKAPSAGNS